MRFKGNKVWAACGEGGKLIVKNRKTVIKYQLDQDYEYKVFSEKLLPLNGSDAQEREKVDKRHNKKFDKSVKISCDPSDNTIDDNAICIYTDGASSGNPGPSGIGAFLYYGKHQKEISEYIGIATNNIAELEAIRAGLLEVKKNNIPVKVFTDSSYAHGVLVLGWKARKNKELVEEIKKIILKFDDIKFIKVKGHAGCPGNERADFLATSAISKG